MPCTAAGALLAAAALLIGACGGSSSPHHRSGPPDGWLAYQQIRGAAYTLRVVKSDGTGDEPLPGRAATNAFAPSFCRATAQLAFTASQGADVVLVLHAWADDSERLLDTTLGTTLLRPAAPALSPDGSQVAFEGSTGGGAPDLYLLPTAGGAPVALAADLSSDAGPAWAPDGQSLFFGSDRSGQWEIHRVNADGTGLAQITTGSQLLGKPTVSPDGLSIAYTRNDPVNGVGHVVIHALAGHTERVLFADAGESDPAFDATGANLAVVSRVFGDPEIVIRDVATGALVQRLTHQDGLEVTPAFAR